MEIITVNADNLEQEHICCAITDKKGEHGVSSKKAWLKDRFPEGLVFKKLDVRGKVLIEYIPAVHAWYPIDADGYMHINCFWVSGQYKGQGYANELLHHCIADAKAAGMHGITVLSSAKKMTYLSDPQYLKYKGFMTADTAAPYFELLYLPFSEDAPVPKFRDCARSATTEEQGMVLYYTNQCPFTDKYVSLLNDTARRHGQTVSLHQISTAQQAHNAPVASTTYGFFYNGEYISHEIMSESKFEKFLAEHGLS